MSQERTTETRPPQPIPEAEFSWTYIAEALFFLGVAIALIKWIRRTMGDVGGSARPLSVREVELRKSVDNIAARHLVERGLTSSEDLMAMPEKEREFLLASTAKQMGAPSPRASSASLPNAGHAAGPAITVHCPLCGNSVTPVAQPVPFVAKCERCKKRVHVRGDGTDRLSIVLSDLPA